ncbi:MAG: hypothetical protein CL920_26885 [Deltaproteobacteria bacterium]|nr:hypothetical protein [Deltaproteobacteria bacterium]
MKTLGLIDDTFEYMLQRLMLHAYFVCLLVVGGAYEAAAMSHSPDDPGALRRLLRGSYSTFENIRLAERCLERNFSSLQTQCMGVAQRKRRGACLIRARRHTWRRCYQDFAKAKRHFLSYTKRASSSYIQKARYELQLKTLCTDHALTMAGPPLPPPMDNFFIKDRKQHKHLLTYIKRYKRHLTHLLRGLRCFRRYMELTLQLHKRSGLKASFTLFRRQQHVLRLRSQYIQGRFFLAFMRRSTTAFVHHSRQHAWNKQTRALLVESQKQLRLLRKRLQKVSRGARQKVQLKRLQKHSLLPDNRQSVKEWYVQLKAEARPQMYHAMQVTAIDLPQQLGEWRRCDLNAQKKLAQQANTAQALFWTGVTASLLGTVGVGAGLYALLESQNKTRYRPAEAAGIQMVGNVSLIGGGSAVLIGAGLIVSRWWLMPTKQAHLKSVLGCPPKGIFRDRAAAKVPAEGAITLSSGEL